MTDRSGYDVCGPYMDERYHRDRGSGPERGFVRSVVRQSPVVSQDGVAEHRQLSQQLEELGIEEGSFIPHDNVIEHTGPKNPQYRTEQARLQTFHQYEWPQAMPQRPQQLAEAGFFYFGVGDKVQCFYCDGGLGNWEPDDDPFDEHARWFPQCGFLQLVKGHEYIQSVQNRDAGDAEDPEEHDDEASVIQIPPQPKLSSDSGYSSIEHDTSVDFDVKEVAAASPKPNKAKLLEENRRLKEERLCKICLDKEIGVVFIPCGHFSTCVACAPAFTSCPVCRQKIQKSIRTFLS